MEDKDTKSCYAKLSVCNLGVAFAVLWGASMFLLALMSTLTGAGIHIVKLMGSLYMGYAPTFLGAVAGLIWGVVVGFVNGAVLAIVYNYCRCCCPCSYCKTGRCSPKK